MPLWYCGHCGYGPMDSATSLHCVICYRQKDMFATYPACTSSTSARAAVMLPPTGHPSASSFESLPLDTSNPESSTTGVACLGKSRPDSITRHGRRPNGYHSESKGLRRGQTFYCSLPAMTKWYCCECRHPCTLIFLETNG